MTSPLDLQFALSKGKFGKHPRTPALQWPAYLFQGNGVLPGLGHQPGHLSLKSLHVLALAGPGVVQDELSHPLALEDGKNMLESRGPNPGFSAQTSSDPSSFHPSFSTLLLLRPTSPSILNFTSLPSNNTWSSIKAFCCFSRSARPHLCSAQSEAGAAWSPLSLRPHRPSGRAWALLLTLLTALLAN